MEYADRSATDRSVWDGVHVSANIDGSALIRLRDGKFVAASADTAAILGQHTPGTVFSFGGIEVRYCLDGASVSFYGDAPSVMTVDDFEGIKGLLRLCATVAAYHRAEIGA